MPNCSLINSLSAHNLGSLVGHCSTQTSPLETQERGIKSGNKFFLVSMWEMTSRIRDVVLLGKGVICIPRGNFVRGHDIIQRCMVIYGWDDSDIFQNVPSPKIMRDISYFEGKGALDSRSFQWTRDMVAWESCFLPTLLMEEPVRNFQWGNRASVSVSMVTFSSLSINPLMGCLSRYMVIIGEWRKTGRVQDTLGMGSFIPFYWWG